MTLTPSLSLSLSPWVPLSVYLRSTYLCRREGKRKGTAFEVHSLSSVKFNSFFLWSLKHFPPSPPSPSLLLQHDTPPFSPPPPPYFSLHLFPQFYFVTTLLFSFLPSSQNLSFYCLHPLSLGWSSSASTPLFHSLSLSLHFLSIALSLCPHSLSIASSLSLSLYTSPLLCSPPRFPLFPPSPSLSIASSPLSYLSITPLPSLLVSLSYPSPLPAPPPILPLSVLH